MKLQSWVFLGLYLLPSSLMAEPVKVRLPNVRAITIFINIDRGNYQKQIDEALVKLNRAKMLYEADGFKVQTLRLVTQPFPDYLKDLSEKESLLVLRALDNIAVKKNFLLAIGPAMTSDNDDIRMMNILSSFLADSKSTSATAIVASLAGIQWEVIKESARLISELAKNSKNGQGNFSFAASAMIQSHGPFFPATYHSGLESGFSVGLESASVVMQAFKDTKDLKHAEKRLSKMLDKVTIKAEKIALKVESEMAIKYFGIDPTPAPNGEISIGSAMERLIGKPLGTSGTLTAARIITESVKNTPVKQVGYSGLMLPVLEDKTISKRWSQGRISLNELLLYSSVCATGLDVIPLPGDVQTEQLVRIIGDMASLSYKWNKPLTARLLPLKGLKAGDSTRFDIPMLENTIIQKLRD